MYVSMDTEFGDYSVSMPITKDESKIINTISKQRRIKNFFVY